MGREEKKITPPGLLPQKIWEKPLEYASTRLPWGDMHSYTQPNPHHAGIVWVRREQLFSTGRISVDVDILAGPKPRERVITSGDFVAILLMNTPTYVAAFLEMDDGLSSINEQQWHDTIRLNPHLIMEVNKNVGQPIEWGEWEYPDVVFWQLSRAFFGSPHQTAAFEQINLLLERAIRSPRSPLGKDHPHPCLEVAQREALRAYLQARNSHRQELLLAFSKGGVPWATEWVNAIYSIQSLVIPKDSIETGVERLVGLSIVRSLADILSHWRWKIDVDNPLSGISPTLLWAVNANAIVDQYFAHAVLEAFGDEGHLLVKLLLYQKAMGVYATYSRPSDIERQLALSQSSEKVIPIKGRTHIEIGGATDGAYCPTRDLGRQSNSALYLDLMAACRSQGPGPVARRLIESGPPVDDFLACRLTATT